MNSKYKIGDLVHVSYHDVRPLYRITNIKEGWQKQPYYDLEMVNHKPSKRGRGIGVNQKIYTDIEERFLRDRKKRSKK